MMLQNEDIKQLERNLSQLEQEVRNSREGQITKTDFEMLLRRVDDLDRYARGGLIAFDTGLDGLFETVSTAPTGIPKNPYDQVKIYVNGATYRLYWYDGVGNTWHYVTATA